MKNGICRNVLLASILLFAFAFQFSGIASAEVELTAWVHPFLGGDRIHQEHEMWNRFAEGFEADNPGVSIDIEIIPWGNRTQKFLTAFSAGKGPDIFYLIPDHIQQFSSRDILAQLDDLISPEIVNDFYSGSLNAGIVNGSLYGIPILQTVESFFYNLDLLEKAGWDTSQLPETWDEFYKMCEMIKKTTGFYGTNMSLGGSPNIEFYAWLWQAGGDVLDDNGNIVINSEETIRALEYMKSLYDNSFVPRDALTSFSSPSGYFEQGMIAVLRNNNNIIPTLIENDPGFDWAIGPILKDKEQATYGTIGSLVISDQSNYKEEAAAFIEHFVSSGNMEEFLNITGYLPTAESLADMFDDQGSVYKEIIGQAEYVLPGVIHPMSSEIGQVIMPIVQGVISGNYSPSEGAIKLDKAVNNVLSK